MSPNAYAPRITDKQARHAEDVCKKVVSRFGTFQQADKDDLVQGALAALVENPPEKDEDVGFCVLGYLTCAIGIHRANAGREDGRLENEKKRLRTLGSENTEQERMRQVDDAKLIIEKALARARLTPLELRYILTYLGGERPIDTSRRFNTSKQAVCNRFRAALTKIARVVEWPV